MRLGMLICCVFLFLGGSADGQIKVGAIGDSLLDEHFDQGIGYSKNALELMITSGQVSAGRTAANASVVSWPDVRGKGFEYNWALAGSTTSSLLSDNQHTSLASQIAINGITKAVMIIGANDLFPLPPMIPTTGLPGSSYEAIYSGFATPAQIQFLANQAVDNVVTAAQTLKLSGVDLIVATVPDYGISPFAKNFYTDSVRRESVDAVVKAWNNEVVFRLTQSVGVPVVDIYTLSKDIWGDHGSEKMFLQLGGVNLNLNGTGGVSFANVLNGSYNPSNVTSDTVDAFAHDGIHPNSAIGGIFANVFMEAFNSQYGDNFVLFSEQQILNNAGPTLGGMYLADSLQASLGGKFYSNYVISAVPEPSTFACLAVIGVGYVVRRRCRPGQNTRPSP